MNIPPALVNYILLGSGDSRRHLQDSPILGDVWIAYATDPFEPVDLLITSHKSTTAAKLAAEIYKQVAKRRQKSEGDARVAPLQNFVAAKLYFDEVAEILVPMSKWWHEDRTQKELDAYLKPEQAKGSEEQKKLDQTVADVRVLLTKWTDEKSTEHFEDHPRSAFERFVALCVLVFMAGSDHSVRKDVQTEGQKSTVLQEARTEFQNTDSAEFAAKCKDRVVQLLTKINVERPPMVFQISRNRPASAAIARSVPTVKADAARRLFEVDPTDINWAVIDSGIDTDHPAFRNPNTGCNQIRHTYDFTFYREIVDLGNENTATRDANLAFIRNARGGGLPGSAKSKLREIAKNSVAGLPLRWDLIEEFVELGDEPATPRSEHGTHVAGIIGAYAPAAPPPDPDAPDSQAAEPDSAMANGMCPGIGIYDFRIIGRNMSDTEFAVIAALQFIRNKNEQAGFLEVKGVNVSLSIPHDVRNYACGGTPVCVESERLIDSGVVVVAAAGNYGYRQGTLQGEAVNNYIAQSITDPGNADRVITVGSTHRYAPFTYGVSYFSSRGPTGDGRLKPDIVAPGERIFAPVLNGAWDYLDGTSMAAPHVSGAAALLMARYPELIGKPDKIKRILCEAASDLGRERNFQGHGMLDVLRALQSQ